MNLNVLLVHATPLSALGGAELSLAEHLRGAPEGVSVDIALPDEDRSLNDYDAVVFGNVRPNGGVGEVAEADPARHWTDRLCRYRGFALKSERDIHPCTHRDGRCVVGRRPRFAGCECSTLMRDAHSALYRACDAVQFLSPAHREVIKQLVEITTPQHVIAPPVDLSKFRVTRPWQEREPVALLLGDDIRVAATAPDRARRAGYEPRRIPYLCVPHEQMPALYNRYQAVVVDPVMFHAFGRVVVEALACGCRVLASHRVGATSWWNPRRACLVANRRFWRLILRGARRRDRPRRSAG